MAALPQPQQLCVPIGLGNQTGCITLPSPQYPEVPPPNNVLEIPVQIGQSTPPQETTVNTEQLTVEGCEISISGPPIDTHNCAVPPTGNLADQPPGTSITNCSAITQYDWYQSHNIDPETGQTYVEFPFGARIPATIGNPHHMILSDTVKGVTLYDSDPTGAWADDCPNSTALIILRPGPPPPPPPPPNGGGGVRKFSQGCCVNKVIV